MPHTRRVSTRRVRLIVAGAFLGGFACFVVGLTIEFSGYPSEDFARTLIAIGALMMSTTRLLARRYRLPAP